MDVTSSLDENQNLKVASAKKTVHNRPWYGFTGVGEGHRIYEIFQFLNHNWKAFKPPPKWNTNQR